VTWEETLKALLKEATPGPWKTGTVRKASGYPADDDGTSEAIFRCAPDSFGKPKSTPIERANAQLIVFQECSAEALADLVEAAREACLYSGNVGWRAQGALLELEEALARLDGVK